jgi:excinuclease ABC subunit C
MRSIATDAVRRVNDLFQLRDCPHKQVMVFAEEKELFPMVLAAGCLRHEIGSCLAPCAAAATVSEYQRKVNAARAFLCGSDLSPLAAMEGEMRTASARLDFERAASIRDRLASLQWLVKHLERLRRARAMSAVYPVRSAGGTVWHLIHRGQARAAIAAPQTAETRERARRLISSLFTGANPADPDASEWTDGVLLVDAWFRRHPAERNRLMTVESVLGRCDG